jgi:hypothetical protein
MIKPSDQSPPLVYLHRGRTTLWTLVDGAPHHGQGSVLCQIHCHESRHHCGYPLSKDDGGCVGGLIRLVELSERCLILVLLREIQTASPFQRMIDWDPDHGISTLLVLEEAVAAADVGMVVDQGLHDVGECAANAAVGEVDNDTYETEGQMDRNSVARYVTTLEGMNSAGGVAVVDAVVAVADDAVEDIAGDGIVAERHRFLACKACIRLQKGKVGPSRSWVKGVGSIVFAESGLERNLDLPSMRMAGHHNFLYYP